MDAKTREIRLNQWIPIFEAQAKSGLCKEEWCEQNGIRRWEFFKRQRELRQMLAQDNESEDVTEIGESDPIFVELPSCTPVSVAPIEVQDPVPSGHIDISYGKFKINLSGKVDSDTLETIIKAVSHAK